VVLGSGKDHNNRVALFMSTRVCFDLSIAGLGYSGIPQDTRCNFHALASWTDLDVSGLVYSNIGDRTTFAGIPTGKTAGWRRVLLQARYLDDLVSNAPPRSFAEYIIRKVNVLERVLTHTMAKVRMAELNNDLFFDLIWRHFLGKSLPASERELLSHLTYYICNISIDAMARKSLPWSRQYQMPAGTCDVLVTPDARPIRVARGMVKISRYHDIIPVMAPDLTGDARRYMDRHMRALRRCVLNGDFFACNSRATEADLVRVFPQARGRTFTAHCIVGGGLFPERPQQADARIRQIIQMRRSPLLDTVPAAAQPSEFARTLPAGRPLRYALTVSALDPKKNHLGMLRAFLAANQQLDGSRRLVVVGSSGWKEGEILQAMRPMSDCGEVILLQSVPLAELRALYSSADLFIFPSLYEGFGLPPVEAMKCGTPVVASDIAALKEVLGPHAHYCNPYSIPSICEAIVRALKEAPEDRNCRVKAAQEHVEGAYDPSHIADVWEKNIRAIVETGRPCRS
jgi:glycosyltransferase involved in cell wall biosynthesis